MNTPQRSVNDDSGAHRRDGGRYVVTPQEVEQFSREGYLSLNGLLTEAEMATLDPWFEHFVQGKEPGMEKDFCGWNPYGVRSWSKLSKG